MKFKAQIFKSIFLLIFSSAFTFSTLAQDWIDDEEDWVPTRRGIEFGLNMGVYQPYSKKPNINDLEEKFRDNAANFYNGNGTYEIGDNTATINSIEDRMFGDTWTRNYIETLLDQAGYNVDQGLVNSIRYITPQDALTYETAMLFGLRVAGFFSQESAIVMSADFVSVKASGLYQIEFNNPLPSNVNSLYYNGAIFGEERRFLGTLGYRTSLYINDSASWLFEIGGTATGTQVMRNYFVVEGEPFQLIYQNIGPGQFNAQTSNLSNMGFGAYASTGLEGLFEKGGNLEANLRFSRDRIKLGSQDLDEFGEVKGYSQIQWNFSLCITWMIPTHVGDYVKASF